MTATAVAPFVAESLLSSHVAALSRAAPYAIPTNGFDSQVIRLVSGAPAADALPLADYAQVAASLLTDPIAGPEALGYGPHSGLPALREWIARREGVSADRVLVTNGGLHGVSLAFAALWQPGSPSRSTIRSSRTPCGSPNCTRRGCCRSRSAPTDWTSTRWPGGCASGQRIKVLYTVPDFHNPSRRRAARRRSGIGWSNSPSGTDSSSCPTTPTGNTVSTAAPERDFSTDSDQVVRVGTFTKTLGPGLRLGWIVAPGLAGSPPGESAAPNRLPFLGPRASD